VRENHQHHHQRQDKKKKEQKAKYTEWRIESTSTDDVP
jgi:hypothetical protein